jgi:hypothetical protein
MALDTLDGTMTLGGTKMVEVRHLYRRRLNLYGGTTAFGCVKPLISVAALEIFQSHLVHSVQQHRPMG